MRKKTTTTRVVALIATKGGVGKTTLATALAIRAVKAGCKVALIDTDPQQSLADWWQFRGEPDNPKIVALDASAEALGHAIADGWDWVFIDGPPGDVSTVDGVVSQCDLVIIPSRPSMVDVTAMQPAVDICELHGKPFAFLFNQVMRGKFDGVYARLLRDLGPVMLTKVGSRKAYQDGFGEGKSPVEVDRDGEATKEIEELWIELQHMVAEKGKVKRHG